MPRKLSFHGFSPVFNLGHAREHDKDQCLSFSIFKLITEISQISETDVILILRQLSLI